MGQESEVKWCSSPIAREGVEQGGDASRARLPQSQLKAPHRLCCQTFNVIRYWGTGCVCSTKSYVMHH
jgi:hypothetical protein